LQLDISNSIAVQQNSYPEVISYGGLGLKNVQRRLDLIYPDKHELVITEDAEKFRVMLRLNLHEQKVTELAAEPMQEAGLILKQA
jgi:two-component system, LytTR family, sensor kinase